MSFAVVSYASCGIIVTEFGVRLHLDSFRRKILLDGVDQRFGIITGGQLESQISRCAAIRDECKVTLTR